MRNGPHGTTAIMTPDSPQESCAWVIRPSSDSGRLHVCLFSAFANEIIRHNVHLRRLGTIGVSPFHALMTNKQYDRHMPYTDILSQSNPFRNPIFLLTKESPNAILWVSSYLFECPWVWLQPHGTIENRVRITDGTATVCAEVLCLAKAGHRNYLRRLHKTGDAQVRRPAQTVSAQVCKYGFWPL